jgi:hypothetical protein
MTQNIADRHLTCIGEMEKYKILAGKPEAKRPVGKSGSRMEDNI